VSRSPQVVDAIPEQIMVSRLRRNARRRRDRKPRSSCSTTGRRERASEVRSAARTRIAATWRQIAEHPPRIMAWASLTRLRESPPERVRQPRPLGRQRQHRRPRPRRETGAVRAHIYLLDAGTSHHLQGEPPGLGRAASTTTTLPARADVSAAPLLPTESHYRRIEARNPTPSTQGQIKVSGKAGETPLDIKQLPGARIPSGAERWQAGARSATRARSAHQRTVKSVCWPAA
jgi:hypothetical protein